MGTTTEHGTNSDKSCELVVTGGEFQEVRKRLLELMAGNREEWEYFCDLEDMIDFASRFTLYVAPSIKNVQAAIIFTIEEYNSGNVALNVLWSSGDGIVDYIPTFIDAAVKTAGEHKAKRIVVHGREAFKRLLEPHGFTLQCVTMRKDL